MTSRTLPNRRRPAPAVLSVGDVAPRFGVKTQAVYECGFQKDRIRADGAFSN